MKPLSSTSTLWPILSDQEVAQMEEQLRMDLEFVSRGLRDRKTNTNTIMEEDPWKEEGRDAASHQRLHHQSSQEAQENSVQEEGTKGRQRDP